jgi:hypothetical protein
MAHFAEINSYGLVLRVVVIDDNDVNTNGGDQSVGAEEKVKSIVSFTAGNKGVGRWVQTCYNNNFRKQYAGIGYTFDSTKNKFISPKPFTSWSLNSNDDWQAPVAYPTVTTYGAPNDLGISPRYFISWDEAGLRWIGKDDQQNLFAWSPDTSSWIATGN